MARRVLERSIEDRANYLIKQRWPVKIRKMNGFGYRSWLDRMYLFEHGVMVFIEYKRPGGELSPGQEHELQELRRFGYIATVCDDPMQAVIFCESVIENAKAQRKSKKV